MAEQSPEQENRSHDEQQPEQPVDRRNKSRRRFLIIGVVAVLVVGAGLFWWHSTYYEDTDDAQIDGNLIQISSRINGHVINVPVNQNQYVDAGTVLFAIDPHDYQTVLQQDEADLASAQANYEAAKVNVPVTHINTGNTLSSASADVASAMSSVGQSQRQLEAAQARVIQAQANYLKAKTDVERYTPLVERDVISKQQYDGAVAAADADKAAVLEAQANVIGAQDAIRMARDRVAQAQANYKNAQTGPQQIAIQRAKADQAAAQVQQAQAALDQARLNLSYTTVVAPTAGIVTTKSVEPGQNVAVGQNLMTLVSLDNLWVTADFKETQLKHMHAGQPVVVSVDAFGRKYDAKVTQIGGATGSLLSLFPPENATGNYVKVVQRIPVRIDFTNPNENRDHRLRPGLSVEPKVRIK